MTPSFSIEVMRQPGNRTPDGREGRLRDFFAFWKLARRQKCFHQFAFAADGHPRKPPEPSTHGHLRLGVQPGGQQSKLAGGNVALLDAVEQMLEQSRRKILATDLRHEACRRKSRA